MLLSTMGPKIVSFIETHIICQFGSSTRILTDNGLNFKNQHMIRMFNRYHIKQSLSTPYYPQANGQFEATNKMIIMILNKMVNDNHHNWHQCLLYVL